MYGKQVCKLKTDDWMGKTLVEESNNNSHSLVAWLLLLQSEVAYPRPSSRPYLYRPGSGSASAVQGSLEILNVVILVGGEKL